MRHDVQVVPAVLVIVYVSLPMTRQTAENIIPILMEKQYQFNAFFLVSTPTVPAPLQRWLTRCSCRFRRAVQTLACQTA